MNHIEKNTHFEVLLSDNRNNDNEELLIHKDELNNDRLIDLTNNQSLHRVIKTLIFLIVMGSVGLGRLYGTPTYLVECLNDPLHNVFSGLNKLIHENSFVAGFFQITSSFLMDLTFFTLFIYWILYVKSCRLVMSCLLFYSLRAFCQILIQMRFPPGYYWDDPNFPSFLIAYGNTTDFFYSGHVGFLNIAALEWYQHKMYKMSYFTASVICYMIFVLLIFRGHYSIDIITGLIASNWIFTHVNMNHEHLNRFFFKGYQKVLKTYINR